jgi:hypothetical protein
VVIVLLASERRRQRRLALVIDSDDVEWLVCVISVLRSTKPT